MEWLSLKRAASFLSFLCIIYILIAYNTSFVSKEKVFKFVPFRYLYQDKRKVELIEDDVKKVTKSSQIKNEILILLYTSFFGSIPWPFFANLPSCSFNTSSIQITHNQNDFYKSDVVIFHSRNMPSLSELNKLHDNRKLGQIWIYFSMESIPNNPSTADINKFFDMTSTYAIGSDIQIPYRYHSQRFKPLTEVSIDSNFKHKNKMVAWVVSNCNGYARNKLALKLLSYGVDIEVSGGCSKNFPKRFISSCVGRPCSKDLQNYKFFFSAENSLCEDYITEKYWHSALDNNVIPIVLGGSNYSDPRLAIPGSFINAMSFNSPKALADHILEVNSNETKYNSYFEWKKKWQLDSNNYYCSLCQKFQQEVTLRKNALAHTMNGKRCSKPTKMFSSWIEKM